LPSAKVRPSCAHRQQGKADEGREEERDCHIWGEDAVKQEPDQRSAHQRGEAHDAKHHRRSRWRHAAVGEQRHDMSVGAVDRRARKETIRIAMQGVFDKLGLAA
jgi:hypothetical protein